MTLTYPFIKELVTLLVTEIRNYLKDKNVILICHDKRNSVRSPFVSVGHVDDFYFIRKDKLRNGYRGAGTRTKILVTIWVHAKRTFTKH